MMLRPVFARRLLVLAVTSLALVAASGAINAPVPAADAGPPRLSFVRLIDSEAAGPAQPFQAFDTHAANAFDLDGDGRLELVSQNDNHRVYVIDVESGLVRAEIYNGLPSWWEARDENGVAVGDVNGNGQPDLVIVNSAGTISVHELTATTPSGRLQFEELWSVTPDPHWIDPAYEPPREYNGGRGWNGYPSADGAAFLADVEGNGKQWVFMQADGTLGHYAFDHTGEHRWGSLWGDGNGIPIVDDIDGDGDLDAVFVTDGGKIVAYDARSGKHHWVWETEVWPGSMPVNAAVVDLDGDGKKEIVTGGRGVEIVEGTAENGDRTKGEPDLANSHATFVALEHDGRVRWEIQPAFANPVMYMTPVTFDVDGDGVLDPIFLDWNTVGHKPGNWEVTGEANLFAVNGRDGSVLWRTSVDSVWSNKGIILVDVDGDGVPEVLAEEKRGNDGLSWFDVRTGEREGHVDFPHWSWVASRGPLAVDVRGDGAVQVIVPLVRGADDAHCEGAQVSVGCREGAFAVYEVTHPNARIWDGGNHLFNAELQEARDLPGAVPVPGKNPVPPEGEAPETDVNATPPDDDEAPQNESSFDGPAPHTVMDPDPGADAGGAPEPGAEARTVPAAGLAFVAAALAIAAVAGTRHGRG